MAWSPSTSLPPAVLSGGDRSSPAARPLGPAQGWCEPAAGGAGWPPGGPQEVLEGLFALRPTHWLRRMPGRETLAWPDDEGPWVLKRYLGDEGGEAWAEWLALRAPRSPGRREAENLLALAADGFAVPRAAGWWEERNPGGGLGSQRFGRSAVLMERVEHRETLRQALQRDPRGAAARWARELCELVAGLHGRGWYHRDLYLQHLILSDAAGEPQRLVLLDVGRARRQTRPRERWFVKDLAALLHSAPEALGTRARLVWFARYCRARGLDSRARRRGLLRAVQAKARRSAAHTPRHRDPEDRAGGGGA